MITRMVVSNFRSIGEKVTIDLGKFTVLVGINGSGKSTVCDVVRFVADSLRYSLASAIEKRNGLTAVRRYSDGKPFDVAIRLELDSAKGTGHYELLFGVQGKDLTVKVEDAFWADKETARQGEFRIERGNWKKKPAELTPVVSDGTLVLPTIAGDLRFMPLYEALVKNAIYNLYPVALREPQKPNPSRPMDEHGGNWGSILSEALKAESRNDLVEGLHAITGDVDDVRVKPLGGYLITQFRHGVAQQAGKNKERWFDAQQESDGTLRIAGILTALLQKPFPNLIGIEEPELTIHPGGIRLLTDFLRQASKSSQLILTTHSPDLLDCLEPGEVRVVHRQNGATSIATMSEEQKAQVSEKLRTLGEILRYEGIKQENLSGFGSVVAEQASWPVG
jgi:predicted ATPase